MLKAALLLLFALVPIWLIYTFGLWLLIAFVALPAAIFVFSRGPARGDEDRGAWVGHDVASYSLVTTRRRPTSRRSTLPAGVSGSSVQ